MEKRYTTREAAAILGYNHVYFLRKLKAGEIQYHRISKRRFYLTDADIKTATAGVLVKRKVDQAEGAE